MIYELITLMGNVTMESDSLLVVHSINNNVVIDSILGLIVADFVSLIRMIPNCELCFVRKSANQVADVLYQVLGCGFLILLISFLM